MSYLQSKCLVSNEAAKEWLPCRLKLEGIFQLAD